MTYTLIDELIVHALPIHLVLDGATVSNIESHLASHQLSGRPLFRETADRETVLAGPWLVPCVSNHSGLERGINAARCAGKGVFWLGEGNTDLLYHHLRRLNVASMPDGRILYFRHYDSDVMAAIVPLLNEQQAAHLFGPCRVIGLVGGSGDGATVERPEFLPEPKSFPIAFERWQIDSLDERQRVLSRRKIAKLLRTEYPTQTGQMSENELYDKILAYERSGQSLNLTSEEALWHWARLNAETHELSSTNIRVKKILQDLGSDNTNEKFVAIVPELIKSYHRAKAREVHSS